MAVSCNDASNSSIIHHDACHSGAIKQLFYQFIIIPSFHSYANASQNVNTGIHSCLAASRRAYRGYYIYSLLCMGRWTNFQDLHPDAGAETKAGKFDKICSEGLGRGKEGGGEGERGREGGME